MPVRLFDSYVNHANRQGARRRSIETAIGALLKKTFPTLRRVRATGSHCDRSRLCYQFPPLAECRKRFDELIQGNVNWGSSGSGFFDIDEWEKEPSPDWLRQPLTYLPVGRDGVEVDDDPVPV
jgi:hypothetical protein